jgi:hypothetical protein
VRLERELAIHLPRQYREFMIAYPFPRSSWAGDFGTPDDVDLLLDLNREKRQLPSSVLSGDAFFISGFRICRAVWQRTILEHIRCRP